MHTTGEVGERTMERAMEVDALRASVAKTTVARLYVGTEGLKAVDAEIEDAMIEGVETEDVRFD